MAAEPPKTWAQRLSELWLQDPKAVVAGMGKWPNGKSQSSAIAAMITTHPECGLGPIIGGMAAWNDIYAAADVLATLRLDEQVCKELRCDRFYHIMEHLEAWPNMEYAYEELDAWWSLATADEEARPYVGDWLLELWTDERKIEEFGRLSLRRAAGAPRTSGSRKRPAKSKRTTSIAVRGSAAGESFYTNHVGQRRTYTILRLSK